MNLYAGLKDTKNLIPEKFIVDHAQLERALIAEIEIASRFVDKRTRRIFYVRDETRHFDNETESTEIWIDEIIEITTVSTSTDNGANYTAQATTEWLPKTSDQYGRASYNKLVIAENGDLGTFPFGQKSIRIAGKWGFSDTRDDLWSDSGDTVQDNPLSDSATSITVSDIAGNDSSGVEHRFQIGKTIKIDSEYIYISDVDIPENKLTAVRGVNGSTPASHTQNTTISIMEPPASIQSYTARKAVSQIKHLLKTQIGDKKEGNTNAIFIKGLMQDSNELLRPYVRQSI